MQPVLSALQDSLTKLGNSPLSTRGEFNEALRREQGRVARKLWNRRNRPVGDQLQHQMMFVS